MDPSTLSPHTAVTFTSVKPLESMSDTRFCKTAQYRPFQSSTLQALSTELLESRKMSISCPIAMPMMRSLPSNAIRSRFQRHISSSAKVSQVTWVPRNTFAPRVLTQDVSAAHALRRSPTPPQLECHGLRRRTDRTACAPRLGQAEGRLPGHSRRVASSTQRPLLPISSAPWKCSSVVQVKVVTVVVVDEAVVVVVDEVAEVVRVLADVVVVVVALVVVEEAGVAFA
mmetsp:Transcript_34350/g.77636  ORF Transcript_34350/g.77636 Transcript_34350/m.77636 type:complete len:227 (-) Transcript_34350:373-1053(-)